MLMLSRKAGESINIGKGVTVRVLTLEGGNVRLGVDAPESIRILRGELAEWPAESVKNFTKCVQVH